MAKPRTNRVLRWRVVFAIAVCILSYEEAAFAQPLWGTTAGWGVSSAPNRTATSARGGQCAVVPTGPTGSDCVCATGACHRNGELLGFPCSDAGDCATDETCEPVCTPNSPTALSLPRESHDALGEPVDPIMTCLIDAGCDTGSGETCAQSFRSSTSTVTSGSIDVSADQFGWAQGDRCLLFNESPADNVGWYELLSLADDTPGDAVDDCYVVTVGLCCSDPAVESAWAYLSRFDDCPCFDDQPFVGIPPILDEQGASLDGFGPASLSHAPCEDANYSGTFMVPPGEYAYQVQAQKVCAGTTSLCRLDDDCGAGVACTVANPDYTIHLMVESCPVAACCMGETCTETNELDCAENGGTFLGGVTLSTDTCDAATCVTGACCFDEGQCDDSPLFNTATACAAGGGLFLGGVTCADDPCPACIFEQPSTCQQVQAVFGPIPRADRNTDNGLGGPSIGLTKVVADDFVFNGSTVDDICWHVGMYTLNVEGCTQGVGFDDTWEIRVYESDITGGIPGSEVCFSTITVLNKLEGTGEATSTWQYAGRLDAPCALPNGVQAATSIGSRSPVSVIRVVRFTRSGRATTAMSTPPGSTSMNSKGVSGTPWIRSSTTTWAFARTTVSRSPIPSWVRVAPVRKSTVRPISRRMNVWTICTVPGFPVQSCAAAACPSIPPNDDCANALAVTAVPDDGSRLSVFTDNTCATDDGPPIDPVEHYPGSCFRSILFGGELHDDVWFSYTAEHCGLLRISSCFATRDVDQIFAIYDGDAGCPLTTDDELACNDDGCITVPSGASDVQLDVTEGQNLLVRIGGWNNEFPGGFQGDSKGPMEIDWWFDEDCSPGHPLPAPSPHDIVKNRYISIDVLTTNPDDSVFDLRVTLTGTLVNGAPTGGVYWANPANEACISSVTTTKPANSPDWIECPVVHLMGCPIIPTSMYDIHAVSEGGMVSNTALAASTQMKPGAKWWGDVVGSFDAGAMQWTPPNLTVNIDDAFAALKTFQDPNAVNATHVSVTDIQPHGSPVQPWGTPNQIVSTNDVFAILLGFQGTEYPGPDLANCP